MRSDIGTSICVQGAPGHRQDRRRPAPRRMAALLLPRPARPLRRARRRPQPGLPRPHRRRAALPRRGPGRPRDDRHPARARPGARRGPHRRRHAQGRRTAGRGAAPCRLGARRPRREALVVPRGSRRWRVPAYEVQRRARRAGRPRGALLRRPAPAAPAAGPPRAAADGALRRLPRRPGAGHRRPVGAGDRRTSARLWPALDPAAVLFRLFSDAATLAAAADGILTADEQRMLLWDKPASHEGRRPLDAGRHGAARRGGRPARPHAEPRARGARRGAGPLPHAAARRRPPRVDRVAHRARRHRPGHHAVGHRSRGTTRCATSAARRTSSSCSTAASGCPAWSSTSPPACCRTWRRGWGRRRSVRDNPGRLTVVPTDAAGARGRGDRGGACRARPPGLGRRHRPGCRDRRPERGPHRRRGRRTAGSTPTTATTRTDRWSSCRRASPRAWSSTGSWSSSRPPSRGRARRAHRAAPALRRAHPRGLGADRRCTPSRCPARCARDRPTRLNRRPRAGARVRRPVHAPARRRGGAPRPSRPERSPHRCYRARSTARRARARGATRRATPALPRGRRRPPHHGSGAGTPRP